MQLPLTFVLPQAPWRPVPVNQLPSWEGAKRVAVDVECRDPDLKELGPGTYRPGCRVVGMSFAIEDGPAHYVPWGHEGGDNVDEVHAKAYFRDNLGAFDGIITGANLGYDLGWIWKDVCRTPKVRDYRDTQVADVMCCELHDRYGLDAMAARWALPGKNQELLKAAAAAHKIHPKRDLWRLPARYVGPYGEWDAALCLQLLRRQEKKIEEEEVQIIYTLECAVTPILVEMRERGVRVNIQKVLEIKRWALAEGAQRLHFVAQRTGVQLAMENVWSAEAMAKPLQALGLKIPQMAKPTKADPGRTLPSITGAFLDSCGEVGQALGRARDMSKLTQFADRVLRYQVNGRVHCTFNQLRTTKGEDENEDKGARFGRLSSDHYNLQQEPGRDDEFGERWRDVYEPEDDEEWVSCDWSQQEPRWGVHYAELLGLPGAKEFADKYRANPELDIHQALADISGMPRKIVKNFVNGRLYNMGDVKLCRSIGCPVVWKMGRDGVQREAPGPEGQAKIDTFNQFAPWLRGINREAQRQAERKGHVWTVLRRKCRFPRDAQGNVDWGQKAWSRIGQGSAADQGKATLVAAHKAGIPLRSMVHDEYNFSTRSRVQARTMRELMMNTVKASVPMHVTVKIGPSWGKGKKMKPEELES